MERDGDGERMLWDCALMRFFVTFLGFCSLCSTIAVIVSSQPMNDGCHFILPVYTLWHSPRTVVCWQDLNSPFERKRKKEFYPFLSSSTNICEISADEMITRPSIKNPTCPILHNLSCTWVLMIYLGSCVPHQVDHYPR